MPHSARPASIIEILQHLALTAGDRPAYSFLAGGQSVVDSVTFAELDRRARTVACVLAEESRRHDRALLLYPPGLDFAAGFLGCLYAGVVAVPAPVPASRRDSPRLRSILDDAEPAVVLTTGRSRSRIRSFLERVGSSDAPRLLAPEPASGPASSWSPPPIDPQGLAYLQYTSGSTGSPKGVMVSHRAMMHNLGIIEEVCLHTSESVIVTWLPTFHDMGLIYGVLQPLFSGVPAVVMSPLSFLQRPYRWLKAMSDFRGTHSVAPNFAYEMCAARVGPRDRRSLDLSRWLLASSGSEKIHAVTLDRFATAFEECGFRRLALSPGYGLAESTLKVTCCKRTEAAVIESFDTNALAAGGVEPTGGDRSTTALVGCGTPSSSVVIEIVDPQTGARCARDRVGEIWVASPSVALGYWRCEEETEATFGARLADDPDAGPFLRTGDLGFLYRGQLFISGRLKDLIIIRGRNLYPEDLELSARSSHPALRVVPNAAFAQEDAAGTEAIVVLQELPRRGAPEDLEELSSAIRTAFAEGYDVMPSEIALVPHGAIPRTTSGKVQRRQCAARYRSGGFEVRHLWRRESPDEDLVEADDAGSSDGDLERFLVRAIAQRAGVAADEVDPSHSVTRCGLDSLQAAEISGAVELRFGVRLALSQVLGGVSIHELARRARIVEPRAVAGGSAEDRGREHCLSQGQLGFWFLQKLAPASGAYVVASAFELSGRVDAGALEHAAQAVVDAHPQLRAAFFDRDGGPRQRIGPVTVRVAVSEAAGWSPARLSDRMSEEAWRPFDLEMPPLFRVRLFRLGPERSAVLLSLHHIVSDFWSLSLILDGLRAAYAAAVAGGDPVSLEPPAETYVAFDRRRRERLDGAYGRTLEAFWHEALGDDLPPLALPVDRRRPRSPRHRGETCHRMLGGDANERLQALARACDTTLFVVLLSAYQALLHRATGQDDMIVGSPAAGRQDPRSRDVVGYVVNHLILRTDLTGRPDFRQLMTRVRATVAGALEHQEYPYQRVVERLQLQRDGSQAPLTPAVFVLQRDAASAGESFAPFAVGARGGRLRFGPATARSLPLLRRPVQFDLTLSASSSAEGLWLSLHYDTDLFDRVTIERFGGHLERILAALPESLDQPIGALSTWSRAERHQALVEWNPLPQMVPRYGLIHVAVEHAAARAPSAIAIVCDDERLTYRELDTRADRIAHMLRARGVGTESFVGVALERSVDLVVALLGVLKAGGAYVPLDPRYPRERIAYLLEDAGIVALLTRREIAGRLEITGTPLVCLDQRAEIDAGSAAPVRAAVDPENLAYVIYTSGSTGKPKGVGVTHRNVVRLLRAAGEISYRFDGDDAWSLFHSFAFDVSVWEIWGALSHGARLVVVAHDVTRDPAAFRALLARQRVTVLSQTPSAFRQLVQSEQDHAGSPLLRNLRYVAFGGEALELESLRPWLERYGEQRPRLINMYGITETTVHSTERRIRMLDLERPTSPIGRPLADLGIFMVDRDLLPVPIGTIGEIFVAGAGLARGYLGRPALTAERFVPDPFSGAAGARLYRSGDLTRLEADGGLTYVGRIDHQVQIRGFRVELQEIETVLTERPEVAEAVVLARQGASGDPQLVAYVVGAGGEPPRTAELLRCARERLPSHMVPGVFVPLDAIPLTAHGKVDRRALPAPSSERPELEPVFAPPSTAVEQELVAIWSKLLGIERIGVHDSFFDLGGHSILLVEMQRAIQRRFERSVPLPELFRHPTIHSLSRLLGGAPAIVRESRPAAAPRPGSELAIVGLAGRFPGAADVEIFWRNLCAGTESILAFGEAELERAGVDPELRRDPSYVAAGGVLEHADRFDACYFGYTPREARELDPQHRVLLECAVHALEDAAIDAQTFDGAIGVFAGASPGSYVGLANVDLRRSADELQTLLGNSRDFLATRIAHRLDLRGPAVNVQSACSTSLLAVHLAGRSLRDGECDVALAGGVSIRFPQRAGYRYQQGGIGSPDGHCRAFDARAAGTVGGNGVGLVVLRRLEDAREAGDRIYGVIKGSAANNDGSSKIGYTAPSIDGQTEVIATALRAADVPPSSIGYVECHGTGTPLGDPIEVAALQRALDDGRQPDQPCVLGSVKTNIGHLDAAAGITSLIKATLAVHRGQIPPTLHYDRPNPELRLDSERFTVGAELRPWRSHRPRRAGVSSFGLGGTNVHVVVEGPPATGESGASRAEQLLLFSARSASGLEQVARQLADHLEGDAGRSLPDVAYTLQRGRARHPFRRMVRCSSVAEAVQGLRGDDAERNLSFHCERLDRSVAFLFPGLGEHAPGMAAALFEHEAVFRRALERCLALLAERGLELADVLTRPDPNARQAAPDLRQLRRQDPDGHAGDPFGSTARAQPAVFAVEYALAEMLASWGIQPAAVIGYSLGEYVAACRAGVLSLEDALTLVAGRAALIDSLPEGGMLAVPLAAGEVEARMPAELGVAAEIHDALHVVAGPLPAIEAFEAGLVADQVACRRLATSHAFHSSMMAPIAERFRTLLAQVELRPPRIPLLSNVTGDWLRAAQATDPDYWVRHLVETVRFGAGLRHLVGQADTVLLEVGPGQTLGSFALQHPEYAGEAGAPVLATMPGRFVPRPGHRMVLETLGRLWLAGVRLDWTGFHAEESRVKVRLPAYPFARDRFWLDRAASGAPPRAETGGEGKSADVDGWFYRERWHQAPPAKAPPGGVDGWLVFGGGDTCGDQVAAALRARGERVIRVTPGAVFARSEDGYTLTPGRVADFGRLLEALERGGQAFTEIVHCWCASPVGSGSPEGGGRAGLDADLDADLDRGVYTLLALARSIQRASPAASIRLQVVTRGGFEVTGDEPLAAARGAIAGTLLVLPQEQPWLTCRQIDLAEADSSTVAGLLLDELTLGRQRRVALRAGARWVAGYQPQALPGTAAAPAPQGGTFLITGGLGNIGLAVARWLARRPGNRLILTGRSPLPERRQWPSIGDDSADPALRRKIAGVLELEELEDTQVMVAVADVADEDAMGAVVARARERFGGVDGVFHAAGVVAPETFLPVAQTSRRAIDLHLRPKIHGLRALSRVLADDPPAFCLAFSSLSAVLGGLGFSAYAAANAAMDAFVRQRSRTDGCRWISIDWDAWAVGVEQDTGNARDLASTVRAYAMSPAEGVAALGRAMDSGLSGVLVQSTGSLAPRLDQWVDELGRGASTASVPAPSAERPNLRATFVPTSNDDERLIAGAFQEVLGIDRVGRNDNFFDLGGTSLSGLQVVARLKERFGALSPVVLFEASTVAQLAELLAGSPAGEPADAAAAQPGEIEAGDAGDDRAIAVIGLAGRFPGAADLEAFWTNLCAGLEAVSFFSTEELVEESGIDPEVAAAENYVPARPVLEEADRFDANFFGYSPREAELMDPQHRLFLEMAWAALENAGYDPRRCGTEVGVFAGSAFSTYLTEAVERSSLAGGISDFEKVIANDRDSLTTRASYKLGLLGPSYSVQTYCSTSLVSVHLACQSILAGECGMALAGGVSIRVPQKLGYLYVEGGQDSPDGHTRPFDARARGTVFGDGVGLVVLKRLSAALRDGDPIRAVIRGSAINNDGAHKAGFTAPSVEGQAAVVDLALARAGVRPETVSYVEAHGSGTELGDPIEVAALNRVFGSTDTGERSPCVLGSVKSNLGHLDRAAGIAGLIKTVLALEREALPPTLHFEQPNPQIDFAAGPFEVRSELSPWPSNGARRRAGVNALGVGGTNAHVVLEEAPRREPSGESRALQLLLLSARTATAVDRCAENLATHLEATPPERLADVAFTLQVGRRPFEHRRFVLAEDRAAAVHSLRGQGGQVFDHVQPDARRHAVFLFPGMGDHYPGMGHGLYRSEPVFAESIDRCAQILESFLGLDLRDVLFPAGDDVPAAGTGAAGPDLRRMLGRSEPPVATGIYATRLGHCAVFATEYALARLLMTWGIQPQSMIGYSLGELVAATIAEVFTLDNALRFVAERARWIEQEIPRGAMTAVPLSEAQTRDLLSDGLAIAAINGPALCVVGGEVAAVRALEQRLAARGVTTRGLTTAHAFHTPMMRALEDRVVDLAAECAPQPPKVPFVSTLTGDWITPDQATDPAFWARHASEPVRFGTGVSQLLGEPDRIFIEVGAGQSLGSFVRQLPDPGADTATVLASLRASYEPGDDQAAILTCLGKLWLAGYQPDWQGFYRDERRRRAILPTYPFERRRFWAEPLAAAAAERRGRDAAGAGEEKLTRIRDWFRVPAWRQTGPLPVDEGPQDAGPWLLLGGAEVGSSLARRLETFGDAVIQVRAGAAFERGVDGSLTVRPTVREDYDRLLTTLTERDESPRAIVALWGLDGYSGNGSSPSAELRARSFDALLYLAQALGERSAQVSMVVVTEGCHRVTGAEALEPLAALAIGPTLVVPQELPHVRCRQIDFDGRPDDPPSLQRLAAQIADELRADVSDPIVSLRAGRRLVRDWAPGPLPPAVSAPPVLKPGGAYLVTGGLGGLGRGLAKHLFDRLGARLVLVGRSSLPPRDDWDRCLEPGSDDGPMAERIRWLHAMESDGAEVLYLDADVADRERMREVFGQVRDRFGGLDGVFHLAGLPAAGVIQLKTPEAAAEVMAPKVEGTQILAELVAETRADLLVLFSSVTSMTGGGPGQVDYCSANAFLDAFAQAHDRPDRRVISIDWAEWQWDAWQAELMAVDPELQAFFKDSRRRFGIELAEGMDALERILASGLDQVVVSPREFDAFLAWSRDLTPEGVLAQILSQGQQEVHPRPILGTSFIAPRNDEERKVATIWQDLLRVDRVGIDDSFFELGGNSLIGIDLIHRLRQAFDAELSAHALYEAPTVRELTGLITSGGAREQAALDERRARGARRRRAGRRAARGMRS